MLTMKKKRIAFHTFGCKLNFSETSTISRKFQENDYEIKDFREEADYYVIHSCAVTAAAEKKCKQAIRQAKKRNPHSQVIVMGCYAQLRPEELCKMDETDLVIGNTEKYRLTEIITEKSYSYKSCVKTIDENNHFTPSYSLTDRTRSFLKIQDGCDYFCSYCTIPYARGRSRSATIEDTMKVANIIARSRIREIVLTGVNIGDFGKHQDESFFELIQNMEHLEGIDRIRISSIEPDLLTDEIIEFVSKSSIFLPHFHIPLQSGSNRILKAMKRKYSREIFADRIQSIKKRMPHACIAADVIVGFPGETEHDFRQTYQFLDSLDISYLHVFSYSPRPGTAALKIPDQVHPSVIKMRSKKLHHLSEQKKHVFYTSNKGKTFHVLFESDPHKDYLFGFTENYIRVKTKFNREMINKIIPVTLFHQDKEGNFVYED